MSGGKAAVDTPGVDMIKLPELYSSTQDRLRSTMKNSLDSGKVYLAERLDDILMRQGFWEDEIHVEDGALLDLEAYDAVASSIIRGFFDEINGHLDEIDNSLLATNRTVSGSPRYVLTFFPSSRRSTPCSYAHLKSQNIISKPQGGGLTMTSETNVENEEVSLLCEMNTRLCDQVEIFHAIAANNAPAAAGHDRNTSEISQLRRQLEEEDQKLHSYPSDKVFAPIQDRESEEPSGSETKHRRRTDPAKADTEKHTRRPDRPKILARDTSPALPVSPSRFAPPPSEPESSGPQRWACSFCEEGMMSIRFDTHCTSCGRRKDMSQAPAVSPSRSAPPPSRFARPPPRPAVPPSRWTCGYCGEGLMSIKFDRYCTSCLRPKDDIAREY